MYTCLYTVRDRTGTPDQQWAPDVYLSDYWEIFETHEEAVERYKELFNLFDIHCAGVAQMDATHNTDWS